MEVSGLGCGQDSTARGGCEGLAISIAGEESFAHAKSIADSEGFAPYEGDSCGLTRQDQNTLRG